MRPRFVLFGDSITQWSFLPGGWGAALTSEYARKADVVLRGYSGYNTRWALFLLDKIFPPAQSEWPPLLVTVFFGANDAALPLRSAKGQHVPLPEYKENLKKIISHIKGICETTHVVLITPPPIDEETLLKTAREMYRAGFEELPSRTNEQAGAYAKACVEVAKEEGVAVIDIWSSMQENPRWQKIYLSDGLHLSQDGNELVFEGLKKDFKEKGLAFENMEWDFPEWSEVDADEPGNSFC